MKQKSFLKIEGEVLLQSCTKCTLFKPIETCFHKNKTTPTGHVTLCKGCRATQQANKPKARKRYYKLDEAGRLTERECTHCRLVLQAVNFSNHSSCPGGKYTVCRSCKQKVDASYEQVEKKKKDQAYYARSSQKIKASVRKWREQNPDKKYQYDKRITKAPIHKKFSKSVLKIKQKLMIENKGKKPSEKKCLDHIIPLKHANVCGLNVPWNLQILLWSENSCKSNKFDNSYENEAWREDYKLLTSLRGIDD